MGRHSNSDAAVTMINWPPFTMTSHVYPWLPAANHCCCPLADWRRLRLSLGPGFLVELGLVQFTWKRTAAQPPNMVNQLGMMMNQLPMVADDGKLINGGHHGVWQR